MRRGMRRGVGLRAPFAGLSGRACAASAWSMTGHGLGATCGRVSYSELARGRRIAVLECTDDEPSRPSSAEDMCVSVCVFLASVLRGVRLVSEEMGRLSVVV